MGCRARRTAHRASCAPAQAPLPALALGIFLAAVAAALLVAGSDAVEVHGTMKPSSPSSSPAKAPLKAPSPTSATKSPSPPKWPSPTKSPATTPAKAPFKTPLPSAPTKSPSPSKSPSPTKSTSPTTKSPSPSKSPSPAKSPSPTKTPSPQKAPSSPSTKSPSPAKAPTPATHASSPSPANAPAPAGSVQIAGPLSMLDTHQNGLLWALSNLDDNRVYRLPYQPMDEDGVLIDVGARVELTCTSAVNEPRTCVKISAARVTTLAAAAPIATDVSMSLLIMAITFTGSCGRDAGYSVSDINDMFFGQDGYATMFDQCSYGQMKIDKATSKIVAVSVPCTNPMNRCNEDAIAEGAEAQAAKALGGKNALGRYSNYVYILPSGMTNPCGWMGLAMLPGSQVWLQSTKAGVANRGTVMQELLHNFGLFHSWKNGVEYDDYSTAMGWGNSCPSAYELGRLRWAKPAVVWKGTDLPAGVFKTVTLPATYMGPSAAFAKLQPDWLGNAWQRNVYIALRDKAKGDEALLPEFDGKLNIHHVASSIDDNPQARQLRDPRVEIAGTVGTNEQLVLSQFKLVVRGGDKSEAGTKMVARICRYSKNPTECKFGGPGGPVINLNPPPSRKKHPPPSGEGYPPVTEPPTFEPPEFATPPPDLAYPPPPEGGSAWYKPCPNCEYEQVDPLVEDYTYGCYIGTDIAGKLIKKDTSQKTYKDCRALCAKTPQCEVAVFSADGKTCILRSSAFVGPDGTNAPSKDVMTSCLVTTNNGAWSCYQHTTLPGEMLTARQSTLMGCQRDCYYDDFCTFFLYTASGNRCILMADLFKADGYRYQTNPDPQVLVGCVLAAEYTGADDTTLGFSPSSVAKLPSKAVSWPRGNARRRLA